MQAIRIRTMIVTVSLVGLGMLSACGSKTDSPANASEAMSATDNGGSMADGGAMSSSNNMATDSNSMAADNSMGDSMQPSNGMEKKSH